MFTKNRLEIKITDPGAKESTVIAEILRQEVIHGLGVTLTRVTGETPAGGFIEIILQHISVINQGQAEDFCKGAGKGNDPCLTCD